MSLAVYLLTMKMSKKGWTHWLNNYATYATYNSHPSKVKDVCNQTDATANFEKLTSSKNLVLLTKAPMGNKWQAIFFHSTVGIPIIPDDLYYVAVEDEVVALSVGVLRPLRQLDVVNVEEVLGFGTVANVTERVIASLMCFTTAIKISA